LICEGPSSRVTTGSSERTGWSVCRLSESLRARWSEFAAYRGGEAGWPFAIKPGGRAQVKGTGWSPPSGKPCTTEVRSAAFVACLHLRAWLVGYHPTAANQAAPRGVWNRASACVTGCRTIWLRREDSLW